MRKLGHIADDAPELLVLVLPRLLLPAPKRALGSNTRVKTHAETIQETAQMRQQDNKLVRERLALAQAGNFEEVLRRDELEANELTSRLAKPGEAEGADDEEEGAQKAAAAAVCLVQKKTLTRATSQGIASLGQKETKKIPTLLHNFLHHSHQRHHTMAPPLFVHVYVHTDPSHPPATYASHGQVQSRMDQKVRIAQPVADPRNSLPHPLDERHRGATRRTDRRMGPDHLLGLGSPHGDAEDLPTLPWPLWPTQHPPRPGCVNRAFRDPFVFEFHPRTMATDQDVHIEVTWFRKSRHRQRYRHRGSRPADRPRWLRDRGIMLPTAFRHPDR